MAGSIFQGLFFAFQSHSHMTYLYSQKNSELIVHWHTRLFEQQECHWALFHLPTKQHLGHHTIPLHLKMNNIKLLLPIKSQVHHITSHGIVPLYVVINNLTPNDGIVCKNGWNLQQWFHIVEHLGQERSANWQLIGNFIYLFYCSTYGFRVAPLTRFN